MISTSVYNTVKVQVLFHDTNTWCVSLSVGEEHDSQPALCWPFRFDRFRLYFRIPVQNKYTQVMV